MAAPHYGHLSCSRSGLHVCRVPCSGRSLFPILRMKSEPRDREGRGSALRVERPEAGRRPPRSRRGPDLARLGPAGSVALKDVSSLYSRRTWVACNPGNEKTQQLQASSFMRYEFRRSETPSNAVVKSDTRYLLEKMLSPNSLQGWQSKNSARHGLDKTNPSLQYGEHHQLHAKSALRVDHTAYTHEISEYTDHCSAGRKTLFETFYFARMTGTFDRHDTALATELHQTMEREFPRSVDTLQDNLSARRLSDRAHSVLTSCQALYTRFPRTIKADRFDKRRGMRTAQIPVSDKCLSQRWCLLAPCDAAYIVLSCLHDLAFWLAVNNMGDNPRFRWEGFRQTGKLLKLLGPHLAKRL